MEGHSCYPMRIDVAMDDGAPAMVLTDCPVSIYYVADGQFVRASLAAPVRSNSIACHCIGERVNTLITTYVPCS